MSKGRQKTLGQYVRMQLFILGIKMKVVQNVIRMSDSQKILVRKSIRTAKEPALVFLKIREFETRCTNYLKLFQCIN